MDWEKRLSPSQLEAATRLDVPVCILAGAGSGKTRVITHRIAYLILEKRVPADRILAVTFTNKAAGEMKERVDRLVPGSGFKAQVGTFHGMAARTLRRWGRAVGMSPSFVIYDDDDWTRLLTRIVVDELEHDKDNVRGVSSLIDSWQAEGLLPDEVPKGHELLFDLAIEAYRRSRERLDQMSAIDFGGLLLKMRALLRSDVGPYVKEGVRHVLVDEYQDVNTVQAEIVSLFGKSAETIAVVGDDDQAIYGWRGASASNLKRFLVTFPGATLVKLEENYRSSSAILEAANGIIDRNQIRLGKVLRPTKERGRNVRFCRARDDLHEARLVVSDILEEAARGTSLDELAVLYRQNAVSRLFEDELRRASLPYRVVGGVRFYDRKEVKDVLATLRCAINPHSDVDTLRFLGAVSRGIGDVTLQKIEATAKRRGTSILLCMADPVMLAETGLAKAMQTRAQAVADRVLELGRAVGRREGTGASQGNLFTAPPPNAKAAVALAIEVSGVADRLQAENTIEAQGRLENLHELLSAAAEYAESAGGAGLADDVTGFLESASLLSSTDLAKDDRGQVTLMTLHAAKGLEFDVVYLCALEEQGFPSARALDDDRSDALEEERRLAYVGITRARRRLVCTWADVRMIQGQKKQRTPSRFLTEIPRAVVDGDRPSHSRNLLDAWRDRQAARARGPLAGAHVIYDDAELVQPTSRRLVMMDADVIPEGPGTLVATTFDVPAVPAEVPAEPAEPAAVEPAPVRSFSLRREVDEAPPPSTTVERDDDGAALGNGARVWHRLYGAGTIIGMRGGSQALVRFDEQRQPRLVVVRHLRTEQSGQ